MALNALIREVPHPFEGAPTFTYWAATRCRTFRVIEGATSTHLAGILVRSPGPQKQFQRLWATNLKNWGLARLPYKRGAVRLVTLAQYRAEIGPPEPVLTLCS